MIKCDGPCGSTEPGRAYELGDRCLRLDRKRFVGSCGGTWREVKEEGPRLERQEALPEDIELARLREENARLQRQLSSERGDGRADALRIAELEGLLSVERDNSKAEQGRITDLCAENQRLMMELADTRSCGAFEAKQAELLRAELAFCKREIYRLDPRLAAARWGRK